MLCETVSRFWFEFSMIINYDAAGSTTVIIIVTTCFNFHWAWT